MEILKSQMKLSPEEKKKEIRRQMYIELRAVEMKRRERVALEIAESCKREKQKEEKIKNEQKAMEKVKQDQLKELDTKPGYISSTLEKMPQRKRGEDELCHLSRVEDKAIPDHMTSDLTVKEQRKVKILHNKWVEEQNTDNEPVKKPHIDYLLFAAKPGPKPQGCDPICITFLYPTLH